MAELGTCGERGHNSLHPCVPSCVNWRPLVPAAESGNKSSHGLPNVEGTAPTSREKEIDHEPDSVKGRYSPSQNVTPSPAEPRKPREFPCADCGVLRSEAEGGRIFTVCDDCWNKRYPKAADSVAPQGYHKVEDGMYQSDSTTGRKVDEQRLREIVSGVAPAPDEQRLRNLCPGCKDKMYLEDGRHRYADGSNTERCWYPVLRKAYELGRAAQPVACDKCDSTENVTLERCGNHWHYYCKSCWEKVKHEPHHKSY